VILSPDAYALWLGETDAAVDEIEALLRPFPADRMAIWPVSKAVGNVRNDYAELAAPVAT
jgi:putative SOS response-associated peptidase YedK